MNTKRILFWSGFVIILGLIIWGLIVAMNKTPSNLGKAGVPAPVSATDHVRGSADGPVTLIEYADFQCPACAEYFGLVDRLFNEASSSLRMVFRHFPLSQHPNAMGAAKASEAAANQGKFWQMYSLIYANQTDWAEKPVAEANAIFEGYASSLGLNLSTFKADVTSTTTLAKIDAEQQEGQAIGINHTPTFFINGREVSPTTYEDFKAIVEAAATSTAQ